MNVKQLKFSPSEVDLRLPMFEQIECDADQLFAVLDKIQAKGDRVASMNVDRSHYTLNVRKKP